MTKAIKRITDFDDYETGIGGIDSIVGEEIIIYSADFFDGNYGEYAVIEYSLNGDENRTSFQTGSKHVLRELHKRVEHGDLPVLTLVKQVGRGFRLT